MGSTPHISHHCLYTHTQREIFLKNNFFIQYENCFLGTYKSVVSRKIRKTLQEGKQNFNACVLRVNTLRKAKIF